MTRATLVLLLLLPACVASPPAPVAADDPLPVGNVTADGVWPYWPARMRVHPLTRLARDPDLGRTIVETRLEFLDRDGHTTRCYGHVYLELDVPLPGDPTNAPSTWSIDLTDGGRNGGLFDPVTRTYLFKLDFGAPRDETPRRLLARYTGADGRTISAEYTVPGE